MMQKVLLWSMMILMPCIVWQSQNRNMIVVSWKKPAAMELLRWQEQILPALWGERCTAPSSPSCHGQETQTWSCKGRPCLIIPFLTGTPCTWQSEIESRGVPAGEGFREWGADGENYGKTLQGHKLVLVSSVLAAEWSSSSICAFVQKKFVFPCWGISLSDSLVSKVTKTHFLLWAPDLVKLNQRSTQDR